jgi:hypothetical protein
VIQDYIKCKFVYDTAHPGQCLRNNDTGKLQAKKGTIDYADLFGKLISSGATSAEKTVRSLVGGIIRGISIASLQNEVAAEVVSSMAGTLAKKSVEQIMFKALDDFISKNNPATPDAKRAILNALAKLNGLFKG